MTGVITALEHNSLLLGEASDQSISVDELQQLMRIADWCPGFCHVGHRQVRLTSYAGLVRLGGRVLEILPKVSEGDASAETCRGILLRLLRLARRINIRSQGDADHAQRRSPLLEAFIKHYFDEVTTLQRGGLIRRYQRRQDDLGLIRGRLLLQRQIARHGMRPDRIACTFDELTPDNDWNRVLKAAMNACRPWLHSLALQRRWSELWAGFDGVSLPAQPAEALGSLSPDRQSSRYSDAVRWARWIIEHLAPNLRAGVHTAPSMLFDMNQLFEQAIAQRLARQMRTRESDWQLRDQVRDRHLAHRVGTNRNAIRLRPDILITGPDGQRFIADTKWKLPSFTNGEIQPSAQDVHQMLAYAAAFRCERLALIYPWQPGLIHEPSNSLRLPELAGVAPILDIICIDVGDDALPVRSGQESPISELF